MKSFTFQLMLLVAMLMATSSAFADVQIVAIPADSSVVDSLSKIELTFPEYGNKVYDNYYKLDSSTVTNDATGESAVTSTKIVWDNELGEYFLNCIPAVTVPGNYTVTIPEASFYFGDDNGYYNLYYEPFVLHYTVVGVNGSVIMVPADSARVDSLKTFTLTFSDKNAVFITSGKHPMLYKEDGTLVGQLDCSKDTVDNQITMTLPTAVTELDNYILQIPDSAFCFEDSIQGKYSLAMTFHYRVRVPLQVVADPADSSVVQSLSEIGLKFPQYGYYFEYDYNMRNASTVTNDATGESAVTETELVYDNSDWDLVYLKCTPSVTTPGNYTVTIPAGTFYFREEINNHELYDKPIVLHYTVSQSTGISDVRVEGSLKGIRVNLNGQRVGDNYQGVVIENGVKRIMK